MTANIKDLLDGNKAWVRKTREKNPTFFDSLSLGQSPEFLWVGCSDSRVPASEITDQMPGSIFVQRNIANLVVHTDANLLSVVYYAVTELKVKHIIICGHYGCGGLKAAMSNDTFGFLDNWLITLKSIYERYREELDSLADEKQRLDRFAELNVMEQVRNMARISFIQEAWALNSHPVIHGWVYSVSDGIIKDLDVSLNSNASLDEIYRYKNKSSP